MQKDWRVKTDFQILSCTQPIPRGCGVRKYRQVFWLYDHQPMPSSRFQ